MALTFKQKIIGGFMALGILPVALYAGLATYMNYQAGMASAEKSMETVQGGLGDRLTHYFETIHAQARTMAGSVTVHDALKEFTAAVNELDTSTVNVDMAKLRARYQTQQEKTPGSQAGDVEKWMPRDPKTAALQHLYISENPNPLGEKQKLDAAEDGSSYSRAHAKFHPAFRDFVEEFGYYDMFLVDAATGNVVYTDFKEVDFMSNVKEGPMADTGFSKLARDILAHSDDELSKMSDFEVYMPSYNDYAAFVGVPIVEDGKTLGAMIFQMPVGVMNSMFESVKELGETADGYIVSSDGTYRTVPHKHEGAKIGTAAADGMKQALADVFENNHDGAHHWLDAAGEQLIGSVGHVKVPLENGHGMDHSKAKTLDWAVAVSMDDHEVLAPVWKQIWIGLAVLGAMALAAVAIGVVAGNVLVRPVVDLANSFAASSKQVNASTGEVVEAVAGLVAASEETSAQSKIIRQNSAEAAGYVKSVASAVGELNISINDISQSIGEVNSLVDDAVGKAQKTDEVVRNLGEAAGKISDVVSLINGLAEQTNLLALNAAIEAARAGDAGRGFAVVADEVKKLATHTSSATVEIGEQIKSIQDVSAKSVQALQGVVEAIHRIRDSATTVSAAVEEQSGVAKQIASSVDDAAHRVQQVDTNMSGIEQATNDTGVAANQVSGAANETKSAFKSLETEVGHVLETMGVKKV
ncbi:MAG: methyl-accepting chemotaxis protein [Alphaproteobacteria bacterium]